MPGLTPYRQIRYPLVGETVDAAAVQNMATDMNTALTTTNTLMGLSRHRSIVTASSTGFNPAKGVDAYATLSAPSIDNGAAGPGAAAYWSGGNPTRLTAPITGLYYVHLSGSVSFVSTITPAEYVRLLVRRGGTTVVASDQIAGRTGGFAPDPNLNNVIMLTAGQYLEFGVRWGGTEAGPLATSLAPQMALMAVV